MSADRIDALERLARLRDSGALTDAEFASQKHTLLGTSGVASAADATIGAAGGNRSIIAEPGFLAGLILSASCAGSAAIAAHDPSFANFRASAIALCLIAAALALFLSWLSARRWLVPTALLGIWGLAQIYFAASLSSGLSTPGWLRRLAILPTIFVLILAWDALRSAWATKRTRRDGQPAHEAIDRWGLNAWLGRNPLALVLAFLALVAGYFAVNVVAQRASVPGAPSAVADAATQPATAASAAPSSSTTAATLDPGPLGWPAPDRDISAAIPEANLAAFRQQELHPAQGVDRPTNWDEIVEQQEHQRALFYDVAHRAPQLITPQDITWVRQDEAGIIQGNCDNRDTSMRVALYPALTDAFCDAHPSR